MPYDIDEDVVLVSKYLLALKSERINAIYVDYGGEIYLNSSIQMCSYRLLYNHVRVIIGKARANNPSPSCNSYFALVPYS